MYMGMIRQVPKSHVLALFMMDIATLKFSFISFTSQEQLKAVFVIFFIFIERML